MKATKKKKERTREGKTGKGRKKPIKRRLGNPSPGI